MPDKHYEFPVAEVGLGQVGVLRKGSREYDDHGAALQRAARMLRSRLDPSAVGKGERVARARKVRKR
ncbi:MAG: hypothetical protein ACOY94_09170 [Bacillota bacterium]